MCNGKIRFDELVKEALDSFEDYFQEVTADVKKDVKEVAKECAKELKNSSPKKSGNYRKGWRATTTYDGRGGIHVVVHNKEHYRLTHLLEDGHAKVKGGRVEGIPHIQPAEDNAAKKLAQRIEASLKK